MTPKKCTFPLEIKVGSVRVKIYRSTNKGNRSYVVSRYPNGKRQLKAFVDFKEAHEEAKSIASNLARDVCPRRDNRLPLPPSSPSTWGGFAEITLSVT